MSKGFNNYIVLLILITTMGLVSCSTQKNTAASRSFHQTKVKYNIFFNGNIAFEEGLQATIQANEDDFTHILPLYPVSNHTAAEAAASQMDKTIEKCRKCIKLHSIKAKPQINPNKRNDPEYKRWLQSEEFNNQMGNVWIRLGEAEFSKGDFLGSIGTFNYVIRHYENDPDIVARCQLWVARAYGELGWQYEAEDALNKVQIDALAHKHAVLYSATKADILLKGKQYHEAIPFIKLAIPNEKRKVFRPRFYYVLAQLLEREHKNQEAIDAYTKCIRLAPEPEMDFNARINRAIIEGTNSVKSLLKMTKLSKNKDKLDAIYGAVGNIYLAAGDTARALENYQLAIEKSTTAGMAKAAILITAGDLYFDDRHYVEAQPCYQEAVSIISNEHEQYARLMKRSEILDELIVEYNTVVLQDSLQHLSTLPEEEQRKIVDKIIEDLIAAEEKAAEEELIAQRESEDEGLLGVDTRNMLGGGFGGDADWYFYNQALIKGGAQDFKKKWGNRPLEDNWRRLSKTISMPVMGDNETGNELDNDSIPNDSTQLSVSNPETDTHKPEYYLQQIPKTPEDLALSDSLLACALYNLIYIYDEKLEDHALAKETYDEFIRRFPNDPRRLDLYYYFYLQALRNDDAAKMALFREQLLDQFPNSQQAYIVSQPDYFDRLRRMAREQDSLYDDTYNAFRDNQFERVKTNKHYAEQNYPLCPLMPRFLFLNAVSVARSEGQEPFITELRDLVTRYPESELSAMAKDFLAMMGQGMESQTGSLDSHLDELRGQGNEELENEETSSANELSKERQEQSLVLLLLPTADESILNQLLYQVALFNFAQFMIRDFDLQKLPVYLDGCALRVSGFESLDEADWWLGLVANNADLQSFFKSQQVQAISITETNNKLVPTRFSVEEYRTFIAKKK